MQATVVIPAFNEEKLIGDTLRSLRAQTITPAEIIVLDNGSTDRTVEIARKYADKVLILPGMSLWKMKQVGVEAAKSPIIVTTDADTVAPPDWLEKLLRHFSDPNVVAVGGPVKPLEPGTVSDLYTKGLSAIAQAGLLYDANMAFRREEMLRSGGYARLKRGWDWELSSKISRYGRVVYDPEAYVVTDVTFSRQLEFANIAWNAGLLGIGIATNNPMSTGVGTGYFIAMFGTAIDQVPDDIHHSQIALAGLALTTVFKGAMSEERHRFVTGVFMGILGHHFFTEDVFDPVWAPIIGSLLLGLTLIIASTQD